MIIITPHTLDQDTGGLCLEFLMWK